MVPLYSDFKPIAERRVLRLSAPNGYVYDTETASQLWLFERIYSPSAFVGAALYQNVAGHYFLHEYHQWDRFNKILPLTVQEAIKETIKYYPSKTEELFGYLSEEGLGKPFTPIGGT